MSTQRRVDGFVQGADVLRAWTVAGATRRTTVTSVGGARQDEVEEVLGA